MIGIPGGVFSASWLATLPALGSVVTAAIIVVVGGGVLLWAKPCVGRIAPLFTLLVSFLLGLSWGSYWGHTTISGRLPVALEGEIFGVAGTVASLPSLPNSKRPVQRFMFDIDSVECQSSAALCPRDLQRIRLSLYDHLSIQPGQRWRLLVKLKRPRGLFNPGTFDYEAWLHANGVQATGYVRMHGQRRLEDSPVYSLARLRYLHHELRYSLREKLLDSDLRHRDMSLLAALIIGDKSGLQPEQEALYQASGISHLMVISGLHVGLVAGVAYFLGRILCTPLLLLASKGAAQEGALLISLFAAIGYAGMAGFSLPTLRALVMLGVFQSAMLLRVSTVPWYGVGLALVIVSAVDPMAAHSPGFWLSFGAVAIILLSLTTRPVVLSSTPTQSISGIEWVSDWLRIQLWLWLLMMPVLIYWFSGFSTVAPLANAISIPLVGSLVVPLALFGALLQLGELAWGVIFWDMAARLLACNEFLLTGLMQWLPVPGWWSAGVTGSIALLAVAGMAILLLPVAWPSRVLGVLLLIPLLLFRSPTLLSEELRMTVLDVGQGHAVWLQAGEDHLLYDAGPRYGSGFDTGSAIVIPYLRQRGVHQLSLSVISHGDSDHAGGAAVVNDAYPAPGLAGEPQELDFAASQCLAGQTWIWGEVFFDVLHPTPAFAEQGGNNASCVVRVKAGKTVLLLTGDIEEEAERDILRRYADTNMLRADVLLVPHHGSKTSSSAGFVEAVAPHYAIVSSGYRNRFGHPHPAVIGRLEQAGAEVIEVALSGALEVSIGPSGLDMVSSRAETDYYWRE